MHKASLRVLLGLVAGALTAGVACSSGGGGALDPDAGTRDGAAADAPRDARNGGDGGPGSGCRDNSDCTDRLATTCFPPGAPVCGGPAPFKECNADKDCADAGPDRICIGVSCGGTSCAPRCQKEADCPTPQSGAAQTCETGTGRCIPKPCSTGTCPPNFVCPSNPSLGCQRKTCKDDSECSGACVNGTCWDGVGRCDAVPA